MGNMESLEGFIDVGTAGIVKGDVTGVPGYKVYLPKYLSAETENAERGMALAWAEAVASELFRLGKIDIILSIHERNLSQPNYTWQAVIADQEELISDYEQGEQLFVSAAQQYYFAQCMSHPEENYAGRFEIELVTYGDIVGKDTIVEAADAKMILRQAAAHYYEKIAKLFPSWQTLYMDGLSLKNLGWAAESGPITCLCQH